MTFPHTVRAIFYRFWNRTPNVRKTISKPKFFKNITKSVITPGAAEKCFLVFDYREGNFKAKMISERILRLRENSKLSQREFAEKIGLSQSMVTKMESGDKEPSKGSILAMCKAFNVEEEYFFAPDPISDKEVDDFVRKFRALPRPDQDFLSTMLNKLVLAQRVKSR